MALFMYWCLFYELVSKNIKSIANEQKSKTEFFNSRTIVVGKFYLWMMVS